MPGKKIVAKGKGRSAKNVRVRGQEVSFAWSRMCQGAWTAGAPNHLFSAGTCTEAELLARDRRLMEWLIDHDSGIREAQIKEHSLESTGQLQKTLSLKVMVELQKMELDIGMPEGEALAAIGDANFGLFCELTAQRAAIYRKRGVSSDSSVLGQSSSSSFSSGSATSDSSTPAAPAAAIPCAKSPKKKRRSESLFEGINPDGVAAMIASAIAENNKQMALQRTTAEAQAAAAVQFEKDALRKTKDELKHYEKLAQSQKRKLDKVNRELEFKARFVPSDAVIDVAAVDQEASSSPSVSSDTVLQCDMLQNFVAMKDESDPAQVAAPVDDLTDTEVA